MNGLNVGALECEKHFSSGWADSTKTTFNVFPRLSGYSSRTARGAAFKKHILWAQYCDLIHLELYIKNCAILLLNICLRHILFIFYFLFLTWWHTAQPYFHAIGFNTTLWSMVYGVSDTVQCVLLPDRTIPDIILDCDFSALWCPKCKHWLCSTFMFPQGCFAECAYFFTLSHTHPTSLPRIYYVL